MKQMPNQNVIYNAIHKCIKTPMDIDEYDGVKLTTKELHSQEISKEV